MKSTVLASLALVLAGTGLAACGEQQAPPAEKTDSKPGVAVTNGRLVLPAVAGNPAALYFDIVNSGDDYAVLRKAEVPNAKETQEMPIASARLSADRKTVTIGLEKMRAVPNFTLQYRIKAADGATVSGELNGTIHRIP